MDGALELAYGASPNLNALSAGPSSSITSDFIPLRESLAATFHRRAAARAEGRLLKGHRLPRLVQVDVVVFVAHCSLLSGHWLIARRVAS
jgi:hypothetical protein